MIGGLRRAAQRSSAGGLTDADLLGRWVCHRDEAAFEALLWRHSAAVLGVCRRVLRDAHEAEDAAQTAFLILARKAPSIVGRQAVASWLYTVAQRTALRVRARLCRRAALPLRDGWALPAPRAEDPGLADLRPVLDEEVSRLPEKYRAPFVLCHIEGRTNEDAARQLNCPVGTVLSRLARARQRLRARLTLRGITLGAGALAAARTGPAATAGTPGALITASVRAAAHAAAGKGLKGVVSADVIALTEEGIRAMHFSKVTAMTAVALALTLLGGGVLNYGTLAGVPDGPPREAAAPVPTGRGNPEDPQDLKARLEQKDREIRALQDRLRTLEAALATGRRLEAALLSRQMDEIKDRLAGGAGGPKTQAMQKDVLTRLEKLVRATADKDDTARGRKSADLHAELAMIQAMQRRVNRRTELWGKQYQGEIVPVPAAGADARQREKHETVRRELKALGDRQLKISRVLFDIANHQ
jgi:RNA polymerase sigma factor (sigma-70 family)